MNQQLEKRITELEEKIQALSLPHKELLTIEEATALFGWSRRKIFYMRDEKLLTFYRYPNTRRRYLKRSEIEARFEKEGLEPA